MLSVLRHLPSSDMGLACQHDALCAWQQSESHMHWKIGHISLLHHWPLLILCWWRCRHDKQGGMDSFYVDHGTWAFAIRKWLGGAKFYLIRSIMNALGYTSLAKKVWAGWQVRLLPACMPLLLRQPFAKDLKAEVHAAHDKWESVCA